MLPSLEVLCSSLCKSQSLYVTLVAGFYISLGAKYKAWGLYTEVYDCRSLSASSLEIVCCLNLVRAPQYMVVVVVVGADALSSNLVLNQACCMKVAEDGARTKSTPESSH